MADVAAAPVTHIAKGAEDIGARNDDEVSARLRSFDLQRHRTRERTLSWSRAVACALTGLLVLAALYAATHHASAGSAGHASTDAAV